MNQIHPTAIIEDGAKIAEGVTIGPYSVIGPEVTIGKDTQIGSHVTISGKVTMGERNRIFKGAAIGEEGQDLHFDNDEAEVVIGNDNVLREFVTIHQPTKKGVKTTLGNHGYLMANAHIAHDCIVGDHVIMVNEAGLAGHVIVGDHALISGVTMVHQFARIGSYAILGGISKASRDIPPYMMANGNPAGIHSLNAVGLRRSKMSLEERRAIKEIYKIYFMRGYSQTQALEKLESDLLASLPEGSNEQKRVAHFVQFLKETKRGIAYHASERREVSSDEL